MSDGNIVLMVIMALLFGLATGAFICILIDGKHSKKKNVCTDDIHELINLRVDMMRNRLIDEIRDVSGDVENVYKREMSILNKLEENRQIICGELGKISSESKDENQDIDYSNPCLICQEWDCEGCTYQHEKE